MRSQYTEYRARRNELLFAATMIVLSVVFAIVSVKKANRPEPFRASVDAPGGYSCRPALGDGEMRAEPPALRAISF
jgi:hypothetical protein